MPIARALWLQASWLLVSLLAVGCASRSGPAPVTAPATVASQDGAWVWVHQAGRFASALVDPDSGRVIREREGIWVHSGFGLAQLRIREVQSRTFECADVPRGPPWRAALRHPAPGPGVRRRHGRRLVLRS